MFLYLTTTGRLTGQPREIEIWFAESDGLFYLIAERGERAQWVRNIQAQPQVKVRLGDTEFAAMGRLVHDTVEPRLAAHVKALFETKYGWNDGLIVELKPI